MKEYSRTYVSVDLGAVRHNIEEARKNIREDTKIMAVVKADAYGHGAVEVSHALSDLVDAYGVAMAEEALELRQSGIRKRILILGYTAEDWFPELIGHRIAQTVYTWEMAEKLNHAAEQLGQKAIVHIKLDTGMGRIGFAAADENVRVVKQISALPYLELEGIFTHFARADEAAPDPIREPFHRFQFFVTKLEREGIHIPIRHVSNSAAIINFPEGNLNMVRSGITTYGLYPSEQVSREVMRLTPAMQWKSVVSYVKDIEAGTSISYGGTFVSDRSMKVATIPVGYADGMKRDLSNKGRVLIRGCYANILGRVCMDQFMVDVSDIPYVSAGDEVTIFGRDGGREIPVEEVAGQCHSFNYEFVCGITARVPRKYVEG
ncbi:MAG: alanine racemase [Eubacterium sp.]|jgi:alanine racemase|nr:alanine racemase [Eubacterium sp.]